MTDAELFAMAEKLLRASNLYGEVMNSKPNLSGSYQGALKGIINDEYINQATVFGRIADQYPELRDELLDSLTTNQIDNVDFYFQNAVEKTIPAGLEDVARIANMVSSKIGKRKLKDVNVYRRNNEGKIGAKHYPIPYEFMMRQQIRPYFQLGSGIYQQGTERIKQAITNIAPYMNEDESTVRYEPYSGRWELLYEAEKHHVTDIRPKS